MRRRSLMLLAGAAALAGCGSFLDGIDGTSSEIAAAVEASGASGRPFRLAEVTDFEWDRLHVFGPYTNADAINRELGFEWGGADDSEIYASDWISLLVFVRGGEVVKAYEQSDEGGHFDCLDGRRLGRGLTPENAVLRVERRRSIDVVLPAHSASDREARRMRRCLGEV